MKYELNEFHRNTKDDELIEDLQEVASFLNNDTVTIDEYNQHGKFHATTLTRRFGSWFCCLDKAGLKPSRSKIGITDEELFDEIENVWIKLGKQPSYSQMRDLSKYSVGTYEHRFGGYRKALEAFIEYINAEEDDDKPLVSEKVGLNSSRCEDERSLVGKASLPQHRTSRNINTRLRFKVLVRDNFKCCACGSSPAKDPAVVLHVDHIVPWSKGGETEIDNLQTLCSKCNLGKSDLIFD